MDASELLKELGLLDAPAEQDINALLQLAASQLHTPVALLSIIDEAGDRQFFKGELGLPEPWTSRRQTPLSHSFCKHVVADNAPFIVVNAHEDARVTGNGAIEALNVTAYLGCPVGWDQDTAVGAVCAIQDTPREWSAEDLQHLQAIASAISTNISLRMTLRSANLAREDAELAQKAQLLATERLRDLSNNVPGAMFQLVRARDGSDRISFASEGCETVLGIAPKDLTRAPDRLWSAACREDQDPLRHSFAASAKGLTKWSHKWRRTRNDGSQIWLQGVGTPRRRSDGRITWNAVVFDVTSEVQAEADAAKQREMMLGAQRSESIARIAGGIAHNFNNLIFAAQGNVEAMRDTAKPSDLRYLDAIEHQMEEGSKLTRQLLSFAQSASFSSAHVNLTLCVQDLARVLPQSIRAGVKVRFTSGRRKLSALTDKTLFENAIVNLVNNASDAIEGDGTINVRLSKVVFGATDPLVLTGELLAGDHAELSVIDSGTGIPPQLRDRIFDPYFTTKGLDQSSGLGLSVVMGLARQSGGTVQALDTPNGGTEMRLLLPLADTRPISLPDDAVPAQTKRVRPEQVTILFAEDHPAVREITAAMLQKEGYNVLVAASGDDAYELYKTVSQSIDLILTDVLMPGSLNGPALVNQIRKTNREIPAVFVSAFSAEAFEQYGIDRNRDTFLTKALKREQLKQAIDDALLH